MKKMFFFCVLAQIFAAPLAFASNFSSDYTKETKKEVAPAAVVVAVNEAPAPKVEPAVVVKEIIIPKAEVVAPVKQVVAPVRQAAPVVEKKVLEAPKKAAAKAVAPPAAALATGEPEALTKYKAIQAQEVWVAKLKKQLDGETSQLGEMRRSMGESFGLDPKKLESGAYSFDSKSGKFVEK